jgi:septal ring factor EnvC (AmiA/AmiB activator)
MIKEESKGLSMLDVVRTIWPILVVCVGALWGYATLHNEIQHIKNDAAALKAEVRDASYAYKAIEKELAKLQVTLARIEERLTATYPRGNTRTPRED